MKRVIFLLFLGAFVLASCEKDPDFSNLDKNFVVITKYDETYNFKTNAKTFYISDTITLISADATSPKWSNAQSAQIISNIRTNFESFGYTYVPYENIRVNDKFAPQYLVGVVAVKDMNAVIYSYYPYWWDYYYYYWWWGGYYPTYPYYPWVGGYTYDVGTTFIEMIDMQTSPTSEVNGTPIGGHPIRWNGVMSGLLDTGSDLLYEQEAIDQAFTQSASYLNVK